MIWYTYIVRCRDDSLYTGITKDLDRRILEHNTDNKLGAKSLRHRRPVSLVYCEKYVTQADAAKREMSIKRWTRKYKLKLIESLNTKESEGLSKKLHK
jgi:putative endonuclease